MTLDELGKPQGKWVTFREEIKVLDCTIRDGGLMNNHRFDDKVVRAVYQACVEAGIDYMELGYKASKRIFTPDQFGTWKYCDEDDLRRIVGDNSTGLKLAVMADAERTDYHQDILPKEKSVLDVVRVATYIHQIPTAVEMIKDAHEKGYETTVNLMAISTVKEHELDDALEVLVNTPVGTIYLVDSFGALYSEQIRDLTIKYL
ncbi:MAG TPA: nucleoid-structuring protein H-NS, partial [bacterium]|nr:nucleoid-structuring protein H-NS [bacterium]